MLDRLPTELLLVIAELAAPQTARSRYYLAVDRRCWFASLASICRSLWHRLRSLIYTEIWIFNGDEVRALVDAVERDPSFAPFTKRLVCTAIPDDALTELHSVFPRFNNVKSAEIRHSGSRTAPLELSTVERLGALKDLSLEECWIAPTLPRLDQLEMLCLRSDNLVVQPGKGVHLVPIRIITELSSASKRCLRLLEQDRYFDLDSPRSDFANLTLFELDATSFETIRRLEDAFPSLTCRIVLRCDFDHLEQTLALHYPDVPPRTFPSKFEIWVHVDAPPGSPRHSSTHVEGYLQALISVAPNLSVVTLPLNLGIGHEADQIAQVRAHIYEFLKQFVKIKVPIHFHNERPDADDMLYPDAKMLDECDGEGYFSDLVAGKVDDPELRNFRVVVA